MNTSFAMDMSLLSDTTIAGPITVGICESQPLVVAGLRSLAQNSSIFAVLHADANLEEAMRTVTTTSPHIMVLDKALGIPLIMDFLARARERTRTAFVIWGSSITEPEALRFLKAGARGVLRKTAEASTVITCFEAVAGGETWLENTLFQHTVRPRGSMRSDLTMREQQVLELVEQGLRNKEIAGELGIQAGTVKIHLKHIFEKTGVRGRYGLALTGLQQRMPSSAIF